MPTTRRFAAGLLALALIPSQAISQSPELYIEHTDPPLKPVRLSSNPIRVPSNQRIRLNVVLDPHDLSQHVENLDIKAENQSPDYWKNRPPPPIRLEVRRLTPQGAKEVSFRIFSSGLGSSFNVEHVNVDLDVIVDAKVRETKLRELLVSTIARGLKDSPQSPEIAALLNSPATIENMIPFLVYIAPGDYEITAYYTPTTPDHWHGHLTSTPARITVYEAEFTNN